MAVRTDIRTDESSWYVDGVIYQLHVRTFADSNGDGIGDFRGLIGRLDYLAGLGITCLWLMPFCESPLRDDGYDVSHYERIHPPYGTMDDFQAFLDAAHAKGMRVITELVINHTSDQHPWFQAARHAPAGSAKRSFYVWSDTTERYAGARVIFCDTEQSNWTWDPAAGAYFWHRFFSHQPDLNFDNPHVRQAVLKVMRFWLDKGVDGLRLDAVAHLFEREGTNCENLPQTHAFLKDVRASMDERYRGRILLAEVNETPERMREYFGDGDECHMAFHFPLMPRLFMAFATERAEPIVHIVERTNVLPTGCRWAVFLRNHDELTLSALDPSEREGLHGVYAQEEAMRLNKGIRRRLANLLAHDHERLVLAHALLLSLPGTPVLYYGDELGMSDNLALPDRDGLRTPMQWEETPTPTGISVEAQAGTPASLLEQVRRLIAIRQRHGALQHGSIDFLSPGHPSVLAFVRHSSDQRVLVVANLSGSAVEATLDPDDAGTPPCLVNLLDEAPVPLPTPGAPIVMKLAPYAVRWLALVSAVEPT
jgi:maltose alpha-D-glucosyltransferase/alpha-amylase